jgi:hypothetical protein
MNKDKNNFNQIISQMEAAFQISKAAMESLSNDSKQLPSDSKHQNTPNSAYSDQNIEIPILIHKENFNLEIRRNISDINLVDNNIQISDEDNVLNSSQSLLSANIPIHTDDLGIFLSDVKAIREVKFSATSDTSTTSSSIPSSSSSSSSLTDDSSENDLESSDSDFSPLLSSSEHREIEELTLKREDDNIKDITLKMMKCALVPVLNPINIGDNQEYNDIQDNNTSEVLIHNNNNVQNNNNFSDNSTEDVSNFPSSSNSFENENKAKRIGEL